MMEISEPSDHNKIMEMEGSEFPAFSGATGEKRATLSKVTPSKVKLETHKRGKSASATTSKQKYKALKEEEESITREPDAPDVAEGLLPQPASVATPGSEPIKTEQTGSPNVSSSRATTSGYRKGTFEPPSSSEYKIP
jgi:hypothetical protein